jgi:hypothetical protein
VASPCLVQAVVAEKLRAAAGRLRLLGADGRALREVDFAGLAPRGRYTVERAPAGEAAAAEEEEEHGEGEERRAAAEEEEEHGEGEERRAAEDGGTYTLAEFVKFYGGRREWDSAAAPLGATGAAGGGAAPGTEPPVAPAVASRQQSAAQVQ